MVYYQQVERPGTWLNVTELCKLSGVMNERGTPMRQRAGCILRDAGVEKLIYHSGHRFFPVYEKENALKILQEWKAKQ